MVGLFSEENYMLIADVLGFENASPLDIVKRVSPFTYKDKSYYFLPVTQINAWILRVGKSKNQESHRFLISSQLLLEKDGDEMFVERSVHTEYQKNAKDEEQKLLLTLQEGIKNVERFLYPPTEIQKKPPEAFPEGVFPKVFKPLWEGIIFIPEDLKKSAIFVSVEMKEILVSPYDEWFDNRAASMGRSYSTYFTFA